MKYCVNCLYPSTKPDLWFNDLGLCAACIAFSERERTNWEDRENEFRDIAYAVKQQKFDYDCIIPVSGGKDSTYQVIKALEYGLRCLAVTATTDSLSVLGRRNLDNISKLGVDHIEITVDKDTRRKISKYALMEIGDSSWAEHATIFTVPIHIAHKFAIPLIIYGENPQHEYGGPIQSQCSRNINERWLSEFGGLNGLRVSDLIEQGILPEEKATLYRYPKSSNLANPSGIFLGAFFPWDGYNNAKISQANGFEFSEKPVEGIGFNYENLDNLQTGLRDFLKYVKYGFGRATDLVCNHIRRGRLTRNQGISHCTVWDGNYPATYLGVSLEEILDEIDTTVEEYNQVIERFYNKELFNYWGDGVLEPKFEIGVGLR